MMPGLSEQFLGVEGHCSCLLRLLSTTCSSGKNVSRVSYHSSQLYWCPLWGSLTLGPEKGCGPYCSLGICIHIQLYAGPLLRLRTAKAKRAGKTSEVMGRVTGCGVETRRSSQVLGGPVGVGGILWGMKSFQHRRHKSDPTHHPSHH